MAYSMGQIIKSVCVCQSASVSVCEHSHGRIVFLDRFSPKLAQTQTPKRKNECTWVNIAPSLPLFYTQNPHIRPRGPENTCKYTYLQCTRIADIFAILKKLESRSTTVTSNFRPEMEIRPFRACAMKNMQYSPYLWPNRRHFGVLKEIWVVKHDGDVRFKSGTGNMAVSCMRNTSGRDYRNSSVILDLAMGQMPRSTERISSYY